MPDTPLPDIEQRVAQDRAALAQSLETLGDTLSPDRLKHEAARAADRLGSDIGRQAWSAARDNPAAFALVGAGLALLLSGTGRRDDAAAHPPPGDRPARPEVAQGSVAKAHAAQVQASDARIRAHLAKQARTPAPSARQMQADLHSGLDRLPEQARTRILKARQAAISAQHAVERRAQKIAGQADTLVRENPVTASAAAFGVGALIAAALPSTRSEDALLGAYRDAMMDDAHAALRTEMARLKGLAHDLAEGDALPEHGAGLQVPS